MLTPSVLLSMELLPVTSTLLLLLPALRPMYEYSAETCPPLLTTKLLPDPPLPTVSEVTPVLFQLEPDPVTNTLLLDDPAL